MRVTAATEARNNFQEIINHVHYTGESVLVSKNHKPWVVIHPMQEDDKNLQEIITKLEKEGRLSSKKQIDNSNK